MASAAGGKGHSPRGVRSSLSGRICDSVKQAVGVAEAKVPARRRSSSLGSGKGMLDKDWEVGGKYQIKRDRLPMWAGPEANDEVVDELFIDDIVLLLRHMQVAGRPPLGFVLPVGGQPGWMPLEDWFAPGAGPVHKVKMPGSWIMGARYAVISEATVRDGVMIGSEWVAELIPGDEVLALELTVNEGDDEYHKVRLRMKISTDPGVVGWISPQTPRGEMLLHPVNLLGTEVVDIFRKPVTPTPRCSWKGGSNNNTNEESAPEQPPSGRRKSYQQGMTMPWDVDGQYRVLESTKMKESHLLGSKDLCRVPAGVLATIHRLELEPTDYNPVALVTLQADGYLNGCKGWIRCTSKEGHDVIDFRDQHQFNKVKQRLVRDEAEKRAKREQAEQEQAGLAKEQARGAEEARQAEEAGEGEPLAGAGAGTARRPSIAGGMPCFTGCLVAMQPALDSLMAKARDAKARREAQAP